MRRFLVGIVLASIGGCLLLAFDWPLDRVVLTSTFGEHRGDHFHSGIDLGGGKQPIYPISPGELVFFYREQQDYTSLPTGLGNFLVLQHQGGIQSLYAHLEEGSVNPKRRLYDRSRALGTVGSSGYSSGIHLHLTIIDTEMGTIINPLLLLPPIPDGQAPEIREVYLQSGQDRINLEEQRTLNRSGDRLYATIYDLREDVTFLWKFAPYKVFLSQDGREITSFTFDSLYRAPLAEGSTENLVLMNTELAFTDIYESPWRLDLGEINLVPGETTLTIFASDFAGNESSREYTLTISD
jgi:hypothetical protein